MMKKHTSFKEFFQMLSESESDTDIIKRRILDHIKRVKYFYKKMIEGGIIPKKDENLSEVNKHDSDKLKPRNLERQAKRFTADGTMTPGDEDDIYQVIREHVKSNPHHCEYWGSASQDHMSNGIHCEKMPDKYLYEMMSDWASTAEERGTKIKDWYDLCVIQRKRWFFSDRQKEIMLKCMDFLQGYVEPGMKRDYGRKYIDPAVAKKK